MKLFITFCILTTAVAEQRSTQSFTLGSASLVDHSYEHPHGPAPPQAFQPIPQSAYYMSTEMTQNAYKPQSTEKPQSVYKTEPAHPDVPANYEWTYTVQDDYAGVDFDANEARNDYGTNGQYRILLPDGRIQTVSYTVEDAYSGYLADVQYEGEAHYEEPNIYAPAASYDN